LAQVWQHPREADRVHPHLWDCVTSARSCTMACKPTARAMPGLLLSVFLALAAQPAWGVRNCSLQVIVLKLPHSGSAWVADTLSLLDGVEVQHEGYKRHQRTSGQALTAPDMARYLDRLQTDERVGRCGFSVNPMAHFKTNVCANEWSQLAVRSTTKLLRWKRTNVVKMAVSAAMYHQKICKKHHLFASSSEKVKSQCQRAVEIKPKGFINDVKKLLCKNLHIDTIANRIGARSHLMTYERLREDETGELTKFAAFVGKENPQQFIASNLKTLQRVKETGSIKRTGESMQEQISNYQEVADALGALDQQLGPACKLGEMLATQNNRDFTAEDCHIPLEMCCKTFRELEDVEMMKAIDCTCTP